MFPFSVHFSRSSEHLAQKFAVAADLTIRLLHSCFVLPLSGTMLARMHMVHRPVSQPAFAAVSVLTMRQSREYMLLARLQHASCHYLQQKF